jgi:hypothetical protein
LVLSNVGKTVRFEKANRLADIVESQREYERLCHRLFLWLDGGIRMLFLGLFRWLAGCIVFLQRE